MSDFENQTSSNQGFEKKEETIESTNEAMAEAMKAGDYDKVAELAQKAKNLESAKQENGERSTEEAVEKGEETEAETVEDEKIETYIENNKEQIKGAAENWLAAKEEGFSKRNEWMINLAGIGATAGVVIEGVLQMINNPDLLKMTQDGVNAGNDATVAIAIAVAGGAILGGMIGKFADYLKRRKQKNNK